MIKAIHPFPARMGPDLAVERLRRIKKASVVLDPMAGSGTVLRHAAEFGHTAVGRDLDPLAILMSRVWTNPVCDDLLEKHFDKLMKLARAADDREPLKWLDEDKETREFTEFWFGEKQRTDLRKIAHGLQRLRRWEGERGAVAIDALKLALSRIIITKDTGASLGRDVSHSRPHKVANSTDYDVFRGFELSVQTLRKRLALQPPPGGVQVSQGDARALRDIENCSVDVVLSSPPYLNAIDYMRGHKLSLIWMGYRLAELRTIRANNVGSERGIDPSSYSHEFAPILGSMGEIEHLPNRDQKMIARYAEDTYRIMSELARVLRPDGRVFLVVGNSCLRKVFIRNSDAFVAAGSMVGLKLTRQVERDLPTRKRYLPMPKHKGAPLGNRMRTETVLTFKHV